MLLAFHSAWEFMLSVNLFINLSDVNNHEHRILNLEFSLSALKKN